jgi:ATP-dependent Clp protease ATP-binding subunit ClpA
MFERYRDDARRAIFFSRWEAHRSNCASIEPKHILLGLTHDADSSKANQLFGLSSSTENFRSLLGVHASPLSSTWGDIPLTNASKRILAYTAEEADKLVSKPIGTEHLLLGLLREKSADVLAALAAVEIDLHSARNRIREDQGYQLLTARRTTKKLR